MPVDHFSLEAIIRPNILALHPYRCARDDYQSGILLDANENSYGHSIATAVNKKDSYQANGNNEPDLLLAQHLASPLHRYPDPSHPQIKSAYAKLRGVTGIENVFLGVGSDEVIDLLFRVACVPGKDKVLICPPTYGMYAVCAQINDVGVVKIPQDTTGGRFTVQVDKILEATEQDPAIKMIFFCSPGNPTGATVSLSAIQQVLDSPSFKGLVIVDEAYIDFTQASHPGVSMSATILLPNYPNLVVLQTMSKSFGLASIRLGFAFSSPELNQILSNTKAPYNISGPTATLAMQALSEESIATMRDKVQKLIQGRQFLLEAFNEMKQDLGPYIGGLDANFIMVPVLNRQTGKPDNVRAEKVYQAMAETQGVVVRFRGKELGCTGCLRVTIGTEEENKTLLERLKATLDQIQ
ncbi:probable histidinol-phosphate transaminase [Serendipita indica DSM 11827]|uniref:histidinol-phosphate transaminase n=1 Tax=Serendipita indica (strain DSM 11827) TaxID=1109443 RepID=G4T631_SERID|nr:probable histidinol-phosphate transaminase [Serendipita indica DSM 11827]